MRLRFLVWLMMLPVVLGFRAIPGANSWAVTRTDPTLWIKVCSTPIFESAEFPEGDPLYGANADFAAVLQAVINDYNTIGSSYLRLAVYPADPNNPGAPAAGDSTFTLASANVRTINVCFAQQTFTGGTARHVYTGSALTGCNIEISNSSIKKAKDITRKLTHEIGHCLGLAHPQELSQSVMSYFSEAYRLQMDDKIGMTYLYPTSETLKEKATLGLACEPG